MKFTDVWNKRFIEAAKLISTWSKDSHKIGAIIVNENKQIISAGYNGFAKGIKDTNSRLNDKALKRELVLHAEENAILNSVRSTKDCIIYIYGYPPCVHCTNLIIQAGIKTICFYNPNDSISDYWKENLKLAKKLTREAKIDYIDLTKKIGKLND